MISDGEQTATLNISWHPDERYVDDSGLPYYATFEVIVKEKADDCANPWMWWSEEKLEIKLPIYITMGNLPAKETANVTVEGGFSITDRVTYSVSPQLDISARIRLGRLQEAKILVNVDIEFINEVLMQAAGSASAGATKDVLLPRKFIKVFAAGGVPVVSGQFGIKARIEGESKGALNLKQKMTYGFPRARFGLSYFDGAWQEVKEFKPEYEYILAGSGDAGANLKLTLIPDLEIHFYDAASGRMLVEPYLYADAGIHGQFLYQDSNGSILSDPPDYWFTSLEAGAGLDLRLYAGLHIFDYNLASYPVNVTVNEVDKFKFFQVIDKTPVAAIPAMSAEPDLAAKPTTGSSRVLRVTGSAANIPSPFFTTFGIGPESFFPFAIWTEPRLTTTEDGASLKEDTGAAAGNYWLHYRHPGIYTVRLGGYSSLGWFVRQIAETTITLTDDDNDGMVDQWESQWSLTDPAADGDGDGMSNLQEYQNGTDPAQGQSLPGSVTANPQAGTWTSSPQLVDVSAAGAQRIYCTLRSTLDGSDPVEPPEPTAESHDPCTQSADYIAGNAGKFQIFVDAGQTKKVKARFRGWNGNGYGPASVSFSYTLDLSIERVSVASNGTQSNGNVPWRPSLSSDGRYVAFTSYATNLVANDTNGLSDVFVHDRQTGETTRVSIASDGTQANGGSEGPPSLSSDGRFVAFSSTTTNLVADDTNGLSDVFVHDRQTEITTRLSIASDGKQGNNDSYASSISSNGQSVAFVSDANNLVVNDTNGNRDVFVAVSVPIVPPLKETVALIRSGKHSSRLAEPRTGRFPCLPVAAGTGRFPIGTLQGATKRRQSSASDFK